MLVQWHECSSRRFFVTQNVMRAWTCYQRIYVPLVPHGNGYVHCRNFAWKHMHSSNDRLVHSHVEPKAWLCNLERRVLHMPPRRRVRERGRRHTYRVQTICKKWTACLTSWLEASFSAVVIVRETASKYVKKRKPKYCAGYWVVPSKLSELSVAKIHQLCGHWIESQFLSEFLEP